MDIVKINFAMTYLTGVVSGAVHTGVKVCKSILQNDLGFSLCAVPSVCCVVTTPDDGKKSEMELSADGCVAIEHQRSSSIRDYLRQLSD